MNSFIVLACALFAVAAAGPMDWRIVGGSAADPGQFPYQVSLRDNGRHNCGGTILNKRWILTAAHCVQSKAAQLTVVTGSTKLNESGVSYQVEQVEPHKEFNPSLLVNDVGLVKVTEDIVFNENVRPMELNTDEIGGGIELTLSGWGTTSYPGSIPNDLQYIRLLSLTTEDCQSKQSNQIFDSEICTLTKRGEGACHGDSGGPLVHGGKVCGIVSWGRPCAVGYPDVFTRVSSYYDWISQRIEK